MKGKEWYEIVCPKFLGDLVIGETVAIDPSQLKGRKIEANLMELINDTNRYHLNFIFKVVDIDGKKALTKFVGHACTRDYIARIVQERTSRVDTNDVFNFSDGKIRIKTIAITNRSVNTEIVKKIRKFIIEEISKEIKDMSIDDFAKQIMLGNIQEKIKKSANKIYPIRFFEFRKTEVL